MKTFWGVTTSFDDTGKVTAAITDTIKAAKKTENSFKETKKKDIYVDWFETEEEAKERAKEALNA